METNTSEYTDQLKFEICGVFRFATGVAILTIIGNYIHPEFQTVLSVVVQWFGCKAKKKKTVRIEGDKRRDVKM